MFVKPRASKQVRETNSSNQVRQTTFAKHTGVRKPDTAKCTNPSQVTVAPAASRELIDDLTPSRYDLDEIHCGNSVWV
jgi:hypothetical protein